MSKPSKPYSNELNPFWRLSLNDLPMLIVSPTDFIDVVKFECVRSKKYGLVAYNNCLQKFINKTLGGTLFTDEGQKKKPENNIEKLEESTVYIEMVYYNKKTEKVKIK